MSRRWGHHDRVLGRKLVNASTDRLTANLHERNIEQVKQHRPVEKSEDYINQEKYEFNNYGYGKNHVKLLHVHRDGPYHTIRELEVDTNLKLASQNDYLQGDNKHIIATDTQKNTVYIMAKKHGIKTPEEFAILLCSHFLYVYSHVMEVSVNVEEYPWERLQGDAKPHNHAFIFSPTAVRFCTVTQKRNGPPVIIGGLRGLRVLKTTQSSFTDFIQDEYSTLQDDNDRVFSTVVSANWEFSTGVGVNFDGVWEQIKDCILEKFAGPPETGIHSPSVQNTLYLASKMALDKCDQIQSIEMRMPNKHYLPIDMSRFGKFGDKLVKEENKEVYHPIDKPSGHIWAKLDRKTTKSKL